MGLMFFKVKLIINRNGQTSKTNFEFSLPAESIKKIIDNQ